MKNPLLLLLAVPFLLLSCSPKSNEPVPRIAPEEVNAEKLDADIIAYGFDKLGCVITIPDAQFINPKTGSRFTDDTYFSFETKLIELGQQRFPISIGTMSSQIEKLEKKKFLLYVPSFLNCSETIVEIKRMHKEFYPNSTLAYNGSSIRAYAQSILYGK